MLHYYITWPLVYTSTRAGPPTMSHIDSVNQEVWAQLLPLCCSVNTLHRLPTYVHVRSTTFTLRKLLFGCYCTFTCTQYTIYVLIIYVQESLSQVICISQSHPTVLALSVSVASSSGSLPPLCVVCSNFMSKLLFMQRRWRAWAALIVCAHW